MEHCYILKGYRRLCPGGQRQDCYLGSSLNMHICYPCGILSVYWACRVFSGSEN